MKSSKNVNTLDSEYSMKIPVLNNRDNFRLDKIIEDYQGKIGTIAKKIIPERKDKKNVDDFFKEKPQPKKKKVAKGILRINDGVLDNVLEKHDDKEYTQMIKRMNKGDTKFMKGIPQIKQKDGTLLNEHNMFHKTIMSEKTNTNISNNNNTNNTNKNPREDSKEKNTQEDSKLPDDFKDNRERENRETNKDLNITQNNLTSITKEKEKKSDLIMPDINTFQNQGNLGNNKDKESSNKDKNINTFFLTGTTSNTNIKNKTFLSNEKDKKRKNLKKNIEIKLNNNFNYNINNINTEDKEEDSDIFSEDDKYFNTQINKSNFEKNFLKRSKEKEAKLKTEKKKNFMPSNGENFLTQENFEYIKGANSVKNIDYLERLRNNNDFFKNKKLRKTLKIEEIKPRLKREKIFDKNNYTSTMKDFIKAVNTEVECYTNTFTDIEKGIKNYDHIQSIHADISPDKIQDKKMMYTDKFVRKYFIYGNSGGQFISEDKQNDDIIERSDNLAKIRPEISFKFKKMIMDRFSEKPLIEFDSMFKSSEYQKMQFVKNTKMVKSIVGDTEKLKSRVENDLVRFLHKISNE